MIKNDTKQEDILSLKEIFEKNGTVYNIIFNEQGGVVNMEYGKREININAAGNSGTVNYAEGNIQSINNINQTDSQEIFKLIESLKGLIGSQSFENELKEEIIDDLETIQEQVANENPKYVKFKKAYQGISNFILKIPNGLAQAGLIVTQMQELGEKLKPMIEKIV